MARRDPVIVFVFILGIGLLFSVTAGEDCPANYPGCYCSESYVHCDLKYGPNIPKFTASDGQQFSVVSITGIRGITHIRPETFQRLPTSELAIHGTGITDIDCDAFKGIAVGLRELNLYNNYLQLVPSCVLQHVEALEELDLRKNNISKLSRDVFAYVPHLKKLSLDGNKIETIELGTFNHLDELTYLNLDDNKISHLGGYMFGELRSLKALDIRSNMIKLVHPKSFDGLESLTHLNMKGNNISTLSHKLFSSTQNLTSLDIEDNSIVNLDSGTFAELRYLSDVDLKDNELVTIKSDVFKGCGNLKYVSIKKNKLRDLQLGSFQNLPHLHVLDLSDNYLDEIRADFFTNSTSLIDLNLANNRISFMETAFLLNLPYLKWFNLENNNLDEIGAGVFANSTSLTYLSLDNNKISFIEKSSFLNSTVNHLTLANNSIFFIEKGSFLNLSNLQYVDLSHNYLHEIGVGVFTNSTSLSDLYLGNNRISFIEKGSFQNLPNLKRLDLGENYLHEIRAGVFTNSTSLYNLNLAKNKISFIENGSLECQQKSLGTLNLRSNKLSKKSWIMLTPILTNLKFLYSLDLSNNPVGDLPARVIDLNQYDRFSFRNCNLVSFPTTKQNYCSLDISENNLKYIRLDITFPDSVKCQLNISHNNVQSISLNLETNYWDDDNVVDQIDFIDAQHNKIKHVDISLTSTDFFTTITEMQFSNNLIADSFILTKDDRHYSIYIHTLNLSYNKFDKVIKYPILNTTDSDSYRRINIKRLNLSHNNISFVSPFAFLGLIENLDLSHNRIEFLGRLLPANISSSDFKTSYLNLSGNPVHQITYDIFSIFRNIVYSIVLANNYLTEFQNDELNSVFT